MNKYDSPGFIRPRQAPFTLAELRCREQEKEIEKIKMKTRK